MRRSLFLRNVLTYNLRLKKSFWHRCFPWNLVKFLRAPNLQTNFVQTSPPEMFLGKDVLKICSKTPMPKCKFNKLAYAILLKSHFNISVLHEICCIFSEQLFLRTPLEGCFCSSNCFYRYSLSMNDKVNEKFSMLRICLFIRPSTLDFNNRTLQVRYKTPE